MLLSRPIEPPDTRNRSPSGGSTLITSAPMSAMCCVANGPSKTAVRSITRTPSSGPGILPFPIPESSFRHRRPRRTDGVRGLHDKLYAGHDGGKLDRVDEHALQMQGTKPWHRRGDAGVPGLQLGVHALEEPAASRGCKDRDRHRTDGKDRAARRDKGHCRNGPGYAHHQEVAIENAAQQ